MNTPREIDEKLAELYYTDRKLSADLDRFALTAQHEAGAEFYYRGKRRVTDMSTMRAEEIIRAALAKHEADNPDDEYGYGDLGTSRGHTSVSSVRRTIAGLDATRAALETNRKATEELEDQYTGWSRFFLVTSSIGHIHSSMHCSTCRLTTAYGWLPWLSGKTETDAVAQCGPALCTVCFPSAPTANTMAKLTAKQAADILAGKTITAEPAKVYCAGSGQAVLSPRRNYSGIVGYCPVCHKHVSGGQAGAARKHQPATEAGELI